MAGALITTSAYCGGSPYNKKEDFRERRPNSVSMEGLIFYEVVESESENMVGEIIPEEPTQ